MVRTPDAVDDFTFIMTCLKHTPALPKPDFEQVAKELGAKGKKACYHRHWAIMKRWGMTGTRQSGSNTTPASGRKRDRPASKKEDAEEDNYEDELGETEKSPSERKKAKVAPAGLNSEVKIIKESEGEADELA